MGIFFSLASQGIDSDEVPSALPIYRGGDNKVTERAIRFKCMGPGPLLKEINLVVSLSSHRRLDPVWEYRESLSPLCGGIQEGGLMLDTIDCVE